MARKIKVPKGWSVRKKNNISDYRVSFKFDVKLSSVLNKKIVLTQRYIDNEILRLSEPYVPRLTGTLINSGYKNTVIGSGKVIWDTPYARRRYFERGKNQTGMRGPQWVRRMMNDRGDEIMKGAEKILKS